MSAWRAAFWPHAGGEHLAQDHLGDLLGLDAGRGEQALDHVGAEFRGRDLGERAAEFADCGAPCGDDDDSVMVVLRLEMKMGAAVP